MTQTLVNYLCKELLACRRSLLITAVLNFAPQTLTFAPHMLHHVRNLPLAFSLLFKVFKDSSLYSSVFFFVSVSFLFFLSFFIHSISKTPPSMILGDSQQSFKLRISLSLVNKIVKNGLHKFPESKVTSSCCFFNPIL